MDGRPPLITMSLVVGNPDPEPSLRPHTTTIMNLRSTVIKGVRYAVLSIGSTFVGAGLLALFVGLFKWPAALASLAGATLSLPLVYLLSRRWVWKVEGRSRFLSEAVPFWVMTILGVLASSPAAGATQSLVKRHHATHRSETAIVIAVVLAVYGAIWLLRFIVLDRFVFKARPNVGS